MPKLPHDLNAESSLIGAALILPKEVVPAVREMVDTDDFYGPSNKAVWEAILTCMDAGETPDMVTVSNRLKLAGNLERIGGPAALGKVMQDCPSTGNARAYARIVWDKARLRDLLYVGAAAAALVDENPDPVKALDAFNEKVREVANRMNAATRLRTMKEAVTDYLDVLEERDRGIGMGLKTGWPELDHLMQGLRAGELIVVGAAPKMGKTGFAANVAVNVAKAGNKVLLVSIEMGELELVERFAANEAGIGLRTLRGPVRTTDQWAKIHRGAHTLMDLPITVLDDAMTDVAKIRSRAMADDYALIIVDYAQLMNVATERGGTRERAIAGMLESLKRLARELNLCVMVLSQVKTDAFDKPPSMEDMAETAGFAKNANVVIGLWRPEAVDEATPRKGLIDVMILASRNTEKGTATLAYNGSTQRISSMATGNRTPPARTPYQ